jgi:hypothetical protein
MVSLAFELLRWSMQFYQHSVKVSHLRVAEVSEHDTPGNFTSCLLDLFVAVTFRIIPDQMRVKFNYTRIF